MRRARRAAVSHAIASFSTGAPRLTREVFMANLNERSDGETWRLSGALATAVGGAISLPSASSVASTIIDNGHALLVGGGTAVPHETLQNLRP